MLRRLGIRSKVLAVLAVPMIVLLGVVGYVGYGAIQEARTASAVETVVNAMEAYPAAIEALQAERDASVAKSLFTLSDPSVLTAARKKTDGALSALAPLAGSDTLASFSGSVRAAFKNSDDLHSELTALRTQVDSGGQTSNIQKSFDAVIDADISLSSVVANAIPNRSVAGYLIAFGSIERSNEDLVREQAIGESIMRLHGSSPGTVQLFVTQQSATELDRTSTRAAVANLGRPELFIPLKFPTPEFTRLRLVLQNGNASEIAAVTTKQWEAEITDQITAMSAVRDKIFVDMSQAASSASSAARSKALLTAGTGLLAVGLSLAFALFVARGIVNPLRRLTAAAADVREQLPKLVEEVAVPGEGPGMELVQIPVESRDEVGRLADAFNSVNATTLQVAQEQAALRGSIAEMFINVARRDQVLLNRQLSFIDSLERTEEDPNALANLFRLDHLATRMRRNAESLLVLAGIDSGRRMRDSMPLSDVIRTASSEIEQYDRIQLDLPIDPHMLGFNALASAHLLAEILENATVFSEPDTPVEVSTGVRGDSVTVTVVDHGLGMSDEEIELANEKIRSVSASDALGAQRLGLFVVGRLAQRLGATVQIGRGQVGTGTGTGTTVEVTFPVVLFQASETMSAAYGLPSPVVNHSVEPVAPPIEDAAAAWLSPPVIEDVPPVVEAVDLGALTDGATQLGLPKRRVRDGATVEEPVRPPVTQAELRERDESKIVLPALVEPRLAAELAGAVEGWKPDVAAPSGSSLPARSRAASPYWQDAPAEEPAVAPAPVAPEVRTGLFSGFRRGVDVPAPAPADLAGRPVRGTDEGSSDQHGAGFYAADYHATRYHGPTSELRETLQSAEAAPDPAPAPAEAAPAPVMPAFVIPGLVPDDEDDEVYVPGRNWEPVPVVRDGSEPATVDTPPQPTVLPTRHPAEPLAAWAPPPAPQTSEPVTPLPDQPREPDPGAARAWAPDNVPAPTPRWEPTAPLAQRGAPVAPEHTSDVVPPVANPAPPEPTTPTNGTAAPGVDSPWAPQQAWAPEQAWAPDFPPAGPAPLARRDGAATEVESTATATPTFSSAAPLGFEPHLDEARAWSAGEHLDPLTHPSPVVPPPGGPQGGATVPPVAAAPLPARTAATPDLREVDASMPWMPAPSPTGFQTFSPGAPATATEGAVPPGGALPSRTPVPISDAPAPGATALPSRSVPNPPVEPAGIGDTAGRADGEPGVPVVPFSSLVAPEAPTTEEAPTTAESSSEPATLPAWQQRTQAESAPAFGDVVGAPAAPTEAPKRRWSLFGRKKADRPDPSDGRSTAPHEVDRAAADRVGQGFARQQPAVFLPAGDVPSLEPQAPVRSSVFGASSQAHVAPEPPSSGPAWASAAGSVAPPGGAPAAFTPPTVAPVFTPPIVHEAPTSWSPPVVPDVMASSFTDAQPVRNGALDDEVAAMLALRSDIQEQALSELSQLSAYRPTIVSNGPAGTGALTRRVPTAIPKAPEIVKPDGGRAVNRDAAQLRSRLSSFQSGTSRGRRATEDAPTGSPTADSSLAETSPASGTQEFVIDDDHDSTPSTPSW